MTPLTVLADVQDLAAAVPAAQHRRVAGLLDDNLTIVVAKMTAGDNIAHPELSFELVDALRLANAALAGHRRALTTPGIARKLSATVAILFRVCLTAGAIQGDFLLERGGGDAGDRDEAAADENFAD
jgi:hypothetical protein